MSNTASNCDGSKPVVSSHDRTRKLFFKNGTRMIRLSLWLRKIVVRDKVHVVSSQVELNSAQRILYREYKSRDLCQENQSGLYFNPYSFLSTTRIFVSKRASEIVATISVIGDGKIGLPADTLYRDELLRFRNKGFRIIEVGALALDQSRYKKRTFSFGSIRKFNRMSTLFAGMINYIRKYTNATHLVIMVNPKHRFIYEYWGFSQFAEVRLYPLVNKPAVPMILELGKFFSSTDTHLPAKYTAINYRVLKPKRSYRATSRDILLRAELCPEFIRSLTACQFAALVQEYPRCKNGLESIRNSQAKARAYEELNEARVRVFSTSYSMLQMAQIDAEYLRGRKTSRGKKIQKSKNQDTESNCYNLESAN